MQKKVSRTHNVDSITMLTTQVELLVKMMGNMGQLNSNSNPTFTSDFCGGSYMNDNCTNIEQAQYMGNFNMQPQQSNPYSNTYNAAWRNHPNFAWKDQGNQSNQVNQGNNARPLYPPRFQQRQYQQESKQPCEVANNGHLERIDRL